MEFEVSLVLGRWFLELRAARLIHSRFPTPFHYSPPRVCALKPKERGARNRAAWLKLNLRFAMKRGGSLRDRARLFYHAGLKPALVFRGKAKFDAARLLQFSFRTRPDRVLQVHARDNGMDVGTLGEFFSTDSGITPPELSPYEPKVIFDIGGHIGSASLYFSSLYPSARLFAFEPVPANFEVCKRNYENLPGSQAFPFAVGSKSGTAVFRFHKDDLRGGRLDGADPTPQYQTNTEVSVPVVSVQDVIRENNLPAPDFLKIDVEGAEVGVLEGLGEHARTVRRMLIETHGEKVTVDCLRWLLDHGFIIRHVSEALPGYGAVWADRLSPS